MAVPAPEERRVLWIPEHVRQRWEERVPAEDRPDHDNLLAVWREAEPIDAPHVRGWSYSRFHEPTSTILVARWGSLRTVIPLAHRPAHEQQHILEQLADPDL